MRLGFYYHIPMARKIDGLYVPSYLGVFLDSLASNVTSLTLLMHEALEENYGFADYKLRKNNIKWINLGVAKPAWHRSFFPSLTLKKYKEQVDCDCIIVRSPTPLATSFQNFFKKTPVFLMIVGDYLEGADHLKESTLRDRIIYSYLKIYNRQFNRIISQSKVLVNSPALLRKYESRARKINLITTTTISNLDIKRIEKSIDSSAKVELLYTGRIDPAKGLFELIDSIVILNKDFNVVLNIVGWEEDKDRPVEKLLRSKAQENGVGEKIFFHGRKKVGPELFGYYEIAHIYVLPSYHEGFPRTIWEAMAKGLPVVATSVGGIPEYLKSEENCLLVEPREVLPLAEAIRYYILNPSKRQVIVNNAYELVNSVTLENQTNKLLTITKDFLNEKVV